MVIVDDGFDEMVEAIEAIIDSAAFGTGTSTVDVTDTVIEGKVGDTDVAVSTSSATGSISIVHTIDSTEGNGNTLGNYGIENAATVLLMHNNLTPLVKDNTKEVITTTTFFIEVN